MKSKFCSKQEKICVCGCGQKFIPTRPKFRFIRSHNLRIAPRNTKTQFKKGHIPWNRGLKGIHLSQKSEFKKGEIALDKHPRWKGGKWINDKGYILRKAPGHPFVDHDGYVREHRLVIEKHLGRYLRKEEVMHHINGNRSDNRIENLKLYPNHSKHIKSKKGM